jgi:hypothetical protein
MDKTYWYCPYCGLEVDPLNVTYQEIHEDCGHPVECIDSYKPTYNQLQFENRRFRNILKAISNEESIWTPEGTLINAREIAKYILKEVYNNGDMEENK